ncbi:MAG: 16S rRNA (cytidine(1402)-2'-O)-methyltransferase [Actinomycetia bacterium]|nr:16S rRNA (cytidine(1402)-2'-O)-methyltransferase [Actinomycetes bacterium]
MDPVGTLVVVGTPIGNLGDLSPRAAAELAGADVIACEDTRRTGRLLSLAGIKGPRLVVANEHTERDRISEVLGRLAEGQRVVLVSDAGMPAISDPGRILVDAVAEAGYRIDVVPGPVAAIAALCASGLRADRFVFEGFLPRKGRARAIRLDAVGDEERTFIVYEAPHRLIKTLADLITVCGEERPAVVARELTKLHEELIRGSLAELMAHFETTEPRGEIVIIVGGVKPVQVEFDDESLQEALTTALDRGSTRRDAVAEVVQATGEPKRRVYALATALDRRPASRVGEGSGSE